MYHPISCATADARPAALWESSTSLTSVPNNYIISPSEIAYSIVRTAKVQTKGKDISDPVRKRSLQKNNTSALDRKKNQKVSESQMIDIIKKNGKNRRKMLKDRITEMKKIKQHPMKIVFRELARTVMGFPPALASEAKIKVINTVADLKARSLFYGYASEHDSISGHIGHPISEYYSPSLATPSSKFSQSYSSNSQFCNE